MPDAGEMAEVIAVALGEGKPVRERATELSRKAMGCSYRWGSLARCHTRFLRPKPNAHRMYAQDQVSIQMVRM
jgi:Glu-tRNA(Gln) amidotransferase subunit E-like FAD-binding protein